MEYTLSQGPNEKAILEQCYRNRAPVPKTILNAPELGIGLNLYYEAFMHLTTCRTFGASGTESPISWLDIVRYCDYQGICGEQRDDVIYHISKMDTVYMKHRLSQAKQQTKGKGK